MLKYHRIEGIDTNKTDRSRDCIICRYWYFIGINIRFQPKACNGCHDMTLKSMSFSDVAVVTIGKDNYRIHFWGIGKNEAMNRRKKLI